MRSRKLSPGLALTRTRISSDSTVVPPVTAERSPPASRMTGADSPVMTDSSTVAAPAMISPSAGMISRAATTTMSPLRSCSDGTVSVVPSGSQPVAERLRAALAQRVGLRLAAALGERLGEVREEHGEPQPDRDLDDEPDGLAVRRRA